MLLPLDCGVSLPLPVPLLLPLEVPPGVYWEPPVAELELNPKYEYTLCRQFGWLKSEGSKDGADCSFVTSPEKVKLMDPAVAEVEVELAIEDGRRSIQGTTTCFPELVLEYDELLLCSELLLEVPRLLLPCADEPLLPGVVELPWPELLPEVPRLLLPCPGVVVLEDPVLPFSEMIAKSILPEVGLISTS